MRVRYLVTGSEESQLMLEELKKRHAIGGSLFPEKLKEYSPKKGDLPILIGGSGIEHEQTHTLSEKIATLYDRTGLIKVAFDQHHDYTKDEKLMAGTHLYHTKRAGFFHELYWFDNLEKEKNLMAQLRGYRIHVTVDLDILKVNYTDCKWMPGRGNFEDLLYSLEHLHEENEIVALDVFGVAPYNSWGSTSRYRLFDGRWIQFEGIGLKAERVVPDGEEKEIAPVFSQAVDHYEQIIKSLSRERGWKSKGRLFLNRLPFMLRIQKEPLIPNVASKSLKRELIEGFLSAF